MALGSLLSFSDSQVPVQVKEVRGSLCEDLLRSRLVGGPTKPGSSLDRNGPHIESSSCSGDSIAVTTQILRMKKLRLTGRSGQLGSVRASSQTETLATDWEQSLGLVGGAGGASHTSSSSR